MKKTSMLSALAFSMLLAVSFTAVSAYGDKDEDAEHEAVPEVGSGAHMTTEPDKRAYGSYSFVNAAIAAIMLAGVGAVLYVIPRR